MIRNKKTVLIVDDEEINRVILSSMLEEGFAILEATNGKEAMEVYESHKEEISVILLDIIMPVCDGLEVLKTMREKGYIEETPVIMISAETGSETMKKAYDLGAVDYIPRSTYEREIVLRRIQNTILLFAKQKELVKEVNAQLLARKKDNELMIAILSHIVEFRNAESGLHVLHINALTELLCEKVLSKTSAYPFSASDIPLIKMASSLHDIGKISIPEEILNKPGRLTAEEFEIIKTHSRKGADLLTSLGAFQNEDLVRFAYDICLHHHERYDGKGYPDGLKGEENPIWAQIVGLADVYDALTSVRCYKRAYTHEEAITMIQNGECGSFSPFLLECFAEIAPNISKTIEDLDNGSKEEPAAGGENLFSGTPSERDDTFLLLERKIHDRFVTLTDECWFRFELGDHQTITFNPAAQKKFGFPLAIHDPFSFFTPFGARNQDAASIIEKVIAATSPEEPGFEFDLCIHFSRGDKWFHLKGEAIYTERRSVFLALGKFVDASETLLTLDELHARSTRIDAPDFNNVDNLSLEQAEMLLQFQQHHFDMVRLISYELKKEYRLEEGKFIATMDFTPFWDAQAIKGKPVESVQKTTRSFRLHERELYFVISRPIKIVNTPYTLELISRIDDDSLSNFSREEEGLYSVAALSYALYRDSMLGSKTRRYYDEKAKDRVGNFSVAILDMDDFKHINDTFGHKAGDIALKKVVDAIRSCIRAEDEIIRYGGDEFILLFEEMPRNILEEKLRLILERINEQSVEGIPLNASAGVYRGYGKVADLFEKADSALYYAKKNKGTFHIIEEGED